MYKKKYSRLIILLPILLLVVCILLFTVKSLENKLSDAITYPFNSIYNFVVSDNKSDNQKLQHKVVELQNKVNQYQQNDTNSKNSNIFYQSQIIGFSYNNYNKFIVTLNKGSTDGIKFDKYVIDSNNMLIGKVIYVGKYISKVRLLLNSSSSIPVRDKNSNDIGYITGLDNMSNVSFTLFDASKKNDIKQDDDIITLPITSIDGKTNEYIIGKIISDKPQKNTGFLTWKVHANMIYSKLNYVYVFK